MGIFKKLRKEQKASVTDVIRVVDMVEKLKELKLIELSTEECSVIIEPIAWLGKDKKFKENWCKNVLTAWFVLKPQPFSDLQPLLVYEKGSPNNNLLALYSISKGLREMSAGKDFELLVENGGFKAQMDAALERQRQS